MYVFETDADDAMLSHCFSSERRTTLEHITPREMRLRSALLFQPQTNASIVDLDGIGGQIDANRRPLGFAVGEVETAVVHRTLDDRPRYESVRKVDLLMGAETVGGEISVVLGAVERIAGFVQGDRISEQGQ
jgi:hypothetical protein